MYVEISVAVLEMALGEKKRKKRNTIAFNLELKQMKKGISQKFKFVISKVSKLLKLQKIYVKFILYNVHCSKFQSLSSGTIPVCILLFPLLSAPTKS